MQYSSLFHSEDKELDEFERTFTMADLDAEVKEAKEGEEEEAEEEQKEAEEEVKEEVDR